MEFADGELRRVLRAGFNQAAEDYQRTRPVCPSQLFDDLIQLAGLNRSYVIFCT